MFVTETNRKTFRAIILLDAISRGLELNKSLSGKDNTWLISIVNDLVSKNYIAIAKDGFYSPTDEGNKVLDTFTKRYKEYLKVFDIYAFVDLEAGEFAFKSYFDFSTDEEWDKFKFDERFQDVRLAVVTYKKLDPAEIVFMSFINEDRFRVSQPGWQEFLVTDDVFREIESICETAIKPSDLRDEEVIEDIINQGTQLMQELLKKEQDELTRNAEQVDETTEEIIEEEVIDYDYYYSNVWDDPYYISPIWFIPLFLW